MPTAIPLSVGPRLTLRQSARFAWLMLQERHLFRRVERASRRQRRIGADLGGGRLLYLTRRWLACHAALADLLGGPERADAATVRALLARGSPGGRTIAAHPARTHPTAARLVNLK